MNLVKANIIGGASKGNTLWVDKDSSLNHWNNGTYITTYKTYGFYYGCDGMKTKDKITSSDYYARIKKEFIKFINEDPKMKPESKDSSIFETIITTYDNKPIFNVIASDDGQLMMTMMTGNTTLNECKKWINKNSDDECDFEIVMKIMETKTIKQIKPTI